MSNNDWINDHFAAASRDLTPATMRHAARLLYMPVSHDPETTKRCASTLSRVELQMADRFATQDDNALFIQRRAFRRFCGGLACEAPRHLSQIDFNEKQNGRPYLEDLPDYWFSFSSCKFGFAGAWSSTHALGIDLEDQTREMEEITLAQKFFSAAEANAVAAACGLERQKTFYRFWVLKEAALKSIGEGMPFGLESFVFELEPAPRVVQVPGGHGEPRNFDAHVIEATIDVVSGLFIHRIQ